MAVVTDTDEYEKQFLQRYLKARAGKLVEELERKLEITDDSFKKLDIKRKIKMVEASLEAELKGLAEGEAKPGRFEVGEKAEDIGEFVAGDVFVYKDVKIPRNIWTYLFSYQMDGVKWMIDIFELGKGGVLADEMGLGKTIQVCATIIGLYNSGKGKNFLILSPATVINHWINQLKQLKPCPSIMREISLKKEGIFVLSYEAFRACQLLPSFDVVFLDEGHKIKNRESQVAQAVKRIQAKSRFVITGTPIQNNLAELWSIFDFVNPNLLGSYATFQDEFERTIKHCRTELEAQRSYHYSIMLRSIIEPFILRRMKSAVEHILPNKLDRVVFIRLSQRQTDMYLEALNSKKFEQLLLYGRRTRNVLFWALTHLRKICNHPALIEGTSLERAPAEPTYESSSDDSIFEVPNHDVEKLVNDSSKLKATIDMLDNWYSENRRVLLFFQTYKMLQIARIVIASMRPRFRCLEMSGQTPTSKRSALIDSFNNNKNIFIFFLTTRVGGLGLNLTGANRVIIYDPDWNPSTDNQAKERIYRYGQSTDVEIYRLICRDTVEEKIYQKQIYKDRLSKKILSNPDMKFDQEYFLDLFDFQTSLRSGTELADTVQLKIEKDELVSVKEEDKRDFNIFKRLNSKAVLTGPELIEYIKRRECSLTD